MLKGGVLPHFTLCSLCLTTNKGLPTGHNDVIVTNVVSPVGGMCLLGCEAGGAFNQQKK